MHKSKFDAAYWDDRYKNQQTGWDIGYPSTPIVTFFNGIANKEASILIPGGGNAHEAQYLYEQGFKNVYLLDWAAGALRNFKTRMPDFPDFQLIQEDFFKFKSIQFDYIIEQTFFCAIDPALREDYIRHTHELLKNNGHLVGLLFAKEFEKEGPPFGGLKTQYEPMFSRHYNIKIMEDCYNSIEPRAGSELFILMEKK